MTDPHAAARAKVMHILYPRWTYDRLTENAQRDVDEVVNFTLAAQQEVARRAEGKEQDNRRTAEQIVDEAFRSERSLAVHIQNLLISAIEAALLTAQQEVWEEAIDEANGGRFIGRKDVLSTHHEWWNKSRDKLVQQLRQRAGGDPSAMKGGEAQ